MISPRDEVSGVSAGPGGGRGRKPAGGREAGAQRELPNNLELERAILAVLLDGRHATAIHKARNLAQHPLAFFQRDHRIAYLACLELDDAGHRVDAQAVSELLSRYDFKAVIERLRRQEILLDSDQLDVLGRDRLRELYRRAPDEHDVGYEDSALAAIGGHNAVAELAASYAPAAGIDRNVALLWDYYLKRRLIQRMQSLCDKAYRTPEEFPKLLDEGGQAILDLGRFNKIASVHAISSAVDETLDAIKQQSDKPTDAITTGLADIDRKLMSLRPGGLYVLAARPGAGKTSLALEIVKHIAGHAANPHGVLFFSLEVDRVDLVKKLLSAQAHINFRDLESGALDENQYELLIGASKFLKNWKLELMDVSDLNIHALRSVVKRRMLESGGQLKLVVLDYLQLLSGGRPDLSEYEKVSEISRVLKVLAREMRIPVLALSQMSRDSEKGVSNQPREPRLSDLRGSGTIEQDADAVVFIHRMDANEEGKEDERRKMKIIVAKNRFGPTGFSLMDFYPAKMQFVQVAHQNEPPPEYDSKAPKSTFDSQPRDEEDVFQ